MPSSTKPDSRRPGGVSFPAMSCSRRSRSKQTKCQCSRSPTGSRRNGLDCIEWCAGPTRLAHGRGRRRTRGPLAAKASVRETRTLFATASSIDATAGKRNEIRSLVLLGWLSGSRPLRCWFSRGDRLYLLQRLCKLILKILFVLGVCRLRKECNLHEEAV